MARGDYPSAKQDQFVVRFPEGMRDDLKAAADHAGRSMNSEIVSRLEQSLYFDIDEPNDFYAKVADEAFVRGIQIGTVEFLLAAEDPLSALQDLRKSLQKPMRPTHAKQKSS